MVDGIQGADIITVNRTATGDVAGAFGSTLSVVGIQGRPVSTTAPGTGEALVWDGTQWAPAVVSGGSGGGGLPPKAMPLAATTKTTADTPDDDFDGPSLAAKWTVVSGTLGTPDPLTVPSSAIYALDNGFLVMQAPNGQQVLLRQSYTIPDGASIVAALHSPYAAQQGGDNTRVGVSVNTDPNDVFSGNAIHFLLEQDGGSWEWQILTGNDSAGPESNAIQKDDILYFRIFRQGLVYSFWFAEGWGRIWTKFYEYTAPSEFTQFWLRLRGGNGTPAPVFRWAWVRQGGAGIDPWPI